MIFDSAKKLILMFADRAEQEARQVGVMRSLPATRTSRWLQEVANHLRASCEGRDNANIANDQTFVWQDWATNFLKGAGLGDQETLDSAAFDADQAREAISVYIKDLSIKAGLFPCSKGSACPYQGFADEEFAICAGCSSD
jgi:hypothetical protein